MNIYSLPPLLAAIAYIPLLGIMLANRPWNRQQRLFVWFLIAAILWSISDTVGRSDFLMPHKLLLLKIVVCTFTLTAVQYHCFISSYYPPNKGRWLPLAYVSLAIIIFLVAIDYVPKDLIIADGKLYPVYGNGIFLIGVPLVILTVRNVHFLWQRLKVLDDPILRNQTAYLLVSIGILTVAVFTTFIPWGNEVPVSHIGNLINAFILTYAVLRHRLLDVRIVFRRGIAWIISIAVGTGFYVLLLLLIHWLADIKLDVRNLALITLAAIAVGVSAYLLRNFFSRSIDRFFYKESYDYRQRLHGFVRQELSGIFNLRELSERLLPLLAGALDCKKTYLLFPDPGSGDV